MARIVARNEAVSWGSPPDPKNPPPAYPGVSAKKFNPLEAQRCYAEAICRERDSHSFHQMLSMQAQLPAALGEVHGGRSEDVMPGYASVSALYEKLGWEEGLSGRMQQPALAQRGNARTRPSSASATCSAQESSREPAAGSTHRVRPSSAGAVGSTQRPRLMSSGLVGSDCLRLDHLAHLAPEEIAVNASANRGHRAWGLMRPASAPARSAKQNVRRCRRCRMKAEAAEQEKRGNHSALQVSGRGALDEHSIQSAGRASSRGRIVAAHKETLRCRQLVKHRLNERLTLC